MSGMEEYNKMLDDFEKVAGDEFEGLDKKEVLKVIAEDAETRGFEEVKKRAEEMLANLESAKEYATEVPEYQKKEIESLGGSVEEIEGQLAEVSAEADEVAHKLVEPSRLFVERMRNIQESHENKELVQESDIALGETFMVTLSDGQTTEMKVESEIQETAEPNPRRYVRMKAVNGNLETDIEIKNLQYKKENSSFESDSDLENKRQVESIERSLKDIENKIQTFEQMGDLEGDLAEVNFEVRPVEGYPGKAWLRFDDELTKEFEDLYSQMTASPFISGNYESYVRKKLQGFSEEQIQAQLKRKEEITRVREQVYDKYGFGNVYMKGIEAFNERKAAYPVLSIGNNTYFSMGESEDVLSMKKMKAKEFADVVLKDLKNEKESLEEKLEELVSSKKP